MLLDDMLACPTCLGHVTRMHDAWSCSIDGLLGIRRDDGIHDFLLGKGAEEHETFLEEYRRIRTGEHRGSEDPQWYRRLPDVCGGDPFAREWKMRRSGMERLIDRLKARALLADGPLLDAGAGNCWLAHNLARLGSQVVAVDVNDDPLDGLVAGEHMLSSTIRFERILASFESLPFRTETFAAVIFNGSFHYASDQLGVLGHARRVVRRGGSIYVLDSPVYRRPSSGERMMSERGPGRARYVTLDSLERFAGTLDLDLRIDMPARSLSTTIRRKIHELRLRRGIACMPLIEFSRVR